MPRNIEQVEHFAGRLKQRASVQLVGGATAGTVKFGPVSAGQRWIIDRVSVIDDAQTQAATAGLAPLLYLDSITADSFVGGAQGLAGGGGAYAMQPISVEAGESLIVAFFMAANALVGVNVGYCLYEIEERPWGPQLPSADTSGFPAVPLQGDDAAGSQDRPDADDLHDRDPLGAACSSCGSPGCSGNCRRHALDGGILTAFPADPSTPSGSDLF